MGIKTALFLQVFLLCFLQHHVRANGFFDWLLMVGENGRGARSVSINGVEVPVNTDWLTDEQLSELGKAEDEKSALETIRKIYDELEPEPKKFAAENITRECYAWLPEVATEEEREMLKELHKTDHEGCKEKIGEFIKRLPEEKQQDMGKYWSFCEHVWYEQHHGGHHEHHEHEHHEEEEAAPTTTPNDQQQHQGHEHHGHRRRRESSQVENKLEELFKTYLSWLSDSQKEQLLAKKAEGKSRAELQSEVLKIYQLLEGEVKEKATELLRGGCRAVLREIVGEDRANELKQLKESGVSAVELGKKVDEMLSAIEDEKKKAKAAEIGPTCKMLYGVPASSRRRRHYHPDRTIEDYFKTHLSWLTDAQKEELKTMKAGGKSRAELQAKAMDYFDQLTGEEKEKAAALLQAGCKELGKYVFGEAKAAEFKQMRESGTPILEISKKVEEEVETLTDEKKKSVAKEYIPICRKFFGVKTEAPSRRRRDHHHEHEGHEGHHGSHTLEDYFKTHLTWLTDAQKEQLRTLKASGSPRADLHKKIYEFYDLLSGEEKEKAVAQLQAGCRELIKYIFGEEKANEIRQMKESGTPVAEIDKKIDEMASQLVDERKKATVQEYQPYCKKLFGIGTETAPARMRRSYRSRNVYNNRRRESDDNEDDAESDDGSGGFSSGASIYAERERGSSSNRGRMNKFNSNRRRDDDNEINGENMDERESSTTRSINSMDENDVDDGVAQTAAAAANADEQEEDNDLEGERLDPHNRWLNTDQKKKVKSWQNEGHSDAEIHSRIHEMFGVSDGVVKSLARGILEKGCETILERLFGEDDAREILDMRKQGASNSEIDRKIATAVSEIRDDDERQEAGKYALTCQQILGYVMRRKRSEPAEIPPQYTLDELLKTHLSWLSDAQKEELKAMKAEGKSRAELQDKTMEFFKATKGDQRENAVKHLYDGCRELLIAIVGKENADEMKRLRDSGTSPEQLSAKTTEFLNAVKDETKQKLAVEFGPTCRSILLRQLPAESRRRRVPRESDSRESDEIERPRPSIDPLEESFESRKAREKSLEYKIDALKSRDLIPNPLDENDKDCD